MRDRRDRRRGIDPDGRVSRVERMVGVVTVLAILVAGWLVFDGLILAGRLAVRGAAWLAELLH